MNAYYILLNGPPECGKSTIAREAVRILTRSGYTVKHESIAGPMKQFIANLLGLAYSSVPKDSYHDVLEETPREFLIRLSEDYLKPNYGTNFFGAALYDRTSHVSRRTIHIIDDAGFDAEIKPLPRRHVCLVRIMRPGFGYHADSRKYLPKPDWTLINDADLKKALSLTQDMVQYALSKWRMPDATKL